MRRFAFVFCLTIALCSEKAGATSFFLRADLAGANEVPPVVTNGSGIAEVAVSDDLQSIFVTLLVSGLSGTVASGTGIYGPADAGSNGPLVFALNVPFPSFNSGILTGAFELPGGGAGQTFADLIAGQLYINVFTNRFAGQGAGFAALDEFSAQTDVAAVIVPLPEVRGQIELTGGPVFVPEPSTMTMLGLGFAATGFAAMLRRIRKSRQ